MSRIERIDEEIFRFKVSEDIGEKDLIRILTDFTTVFPKGVLTYGDINTETLVEQIQARDYAVQRSALCMDDDRSLGLEPPNTGYLNKGDHALSISMYYNFLQFKVGAQNGELFKRNTEIGEEFGRIAMIEVFLEDKLETFLKMRGMKYFATPKTLTETVRVNEGWDRQRIPRLNDYVEFAGFIEEWSKNNCPSYYKDGWHLGRETSEKMVSEFGSTNVRVCTRYFWQNYLINKEPKIQKKDVEIDIVDPGFIKEKEPDIIMLGENFIEPSARPGSTGKDIHFNYFSTGKTIEVPHLIKSDEKNIKNAYMLTERFPGTKIVMMENPEGLPRFSMSKLDEVKQGYNKEVINCLQALSSIHNYIR